MEKSTQKVVLGIIFLVSIYFFIQNVEEVILFLTNATIAVIAGVVAYFSGKKWLELNN